MDYKLKSLIPFLTHEAINKTWIARQVWGNKSQSYLSGTFSQKMRTLLGEDNSGMVQEWKDWEIERLIEIRREFKERI